jgi:hypothetical protein
MTNMTPRSFLLARLRVVVLFGAIVVSVMLMVPATVSADATHIKVVNGYVMDSAGHRISGAAVSVTIDGNTLSVISDSNGLYLVLFNPNQWTVNSIIHVEAIYNSQTATNETPADDSTTQLVNVEGTFAIEEFGGPLGLLFAGGFVAAISIVLLADNKMGRRKGV